MLEQYDNRYNNILIDLPLRDTAELVLKFILPLSSFLPSPLPLTVTLTLINNSFIPLLHVSTLTIERDSELVKLSVLDTILTLLLSSGHPMSRANDADYLVVLLEPGTKLKDPPLLLLDNQQSG